eukprot:1873731-Rhodomonas_salina.2
MFQATQPSSCEPSLDMQLSPSCVPSFLLCLGKSDQRLSGEHLFVPAAVSKCFCSSNVQIQEACDPHGNTSCSNTLGKKRQHQSHNMSERHQPAAEQRGVQESCTCLAVVRTATPPNTPMRPTIGPVMMFQFMNTAGPKRAISNFFSFKRGGGRRVRFFSTRGTQNLGFCLTREAKKGWQSGSTGTAPSGTNCTNSGTAFRSTCVCKVVGELRTFVRVNCTFGYKDV